MNLNLRITEKEKFINDMKRAWNLGIDIIFKTHATIIIFIIYLGIFNLLVFQFVENKFFSGLALTAIGALIGTFLVFVFVEVSMRIKKEGDLEKCKNYTFSVLKISSKKFVYEFIRLKHEHEDYTNDIFLEEEGWIDKIFNDITGRKLIEYIKDLDKVNWLTYATALVDSGNARQLEKIFDKLINLDIMERPLIDYLSEFIVAKERLSHLVVAGDCSLSNDGDGNGKCYTIKKMLCKSIQIYNETSKYDDVICEPSV